MFYLNCAVSCVCVCYVGTCMYVYMYEYVYIHTCTYVHTHTYNCINIILFVLYHNTVSIITELDECHFGEVCCC